MWMGSGGRCGSAGDTVEEAARHGSGTLAFHVEGAAAELTVTNLLRRLVRCRVCDLAMSCHRIPGASESDIDRPTKPRNACSTFSSST